MTQFDSLYAVPSRNGLYKSKEFHGSGCKIVNMGELFAYPFLGNQEMKRLQVDDSELARFGLADGDLLFARRSLVESGAGKCVLVVDPHEPLVFESSLIRVRLDASEALPRYYYYYFSSPVGRARVTPIITGAAQKGIRGSELARIQVHSPPLPIQRRIAGILSVYDDLIENNTKRIKILEQMARALFFNFKGLGSASSTTRSLGELSDAAGGTIRTGPFGSSLHQSDYTEAGTPVVMPKDIKNGRISEATIARVPAEIAERLSQHVLHKGDIVYGRRGDIGRRGYIGDRESGWLCGTGCLRISLPDGALSPRYLHEYLGQEDVIAQIAGRAVGSTMPNLNTKILRSIPIDVPAREIQTQFDEAVASADGLRDNLIAQLQNLRETRDLLLLRLISGEIDVDNLDLPGAAQ